MFTYEYATYEGQSVRKRAFGFAAANAAIVLLLGVMILAWPKATLAVVAVFFGIHLVIVGLLQVVAAASAEMPGWARIVVGLLGVATTVIGVICMFSPFTSLRILVLFIAIGWFSDALTALIIGARERGGNRVWAWVSAIISFVAAIVLLTWPGLTLKLMVLLTGWTLVIFGIIGLVTVFMAWRGSKDAVAA